MGFKSCVGIIVDGWVDEKWCGGSGRSIRALLGWCLREARFGDADNAEEGGDSAFPTC
jgi:hypothetical protein